MDASLWIAKTGLTAQQTRMSVISNNLANVNTTGFKKDRAVFEDLLYQNIVPAGNLITVSPDGTVFAQLPTDPEAAAIAIGQLMLRDASETQLVRRPDGLFEPRAEAFKGQDFPTGPKPVSVSPGMLEGSNVNPVATMVKMLDFSRQFEMQLKLVKETQSIDEAGSTMMRLP